MVEEMKTKNDFKTLKDFTDYALTRSVFSLEELTEYYTTWSCMYVIKMTYNAALKNRIIRKRLVEDVGLSEQDYWGFMQLSDNNLKQIAELGDVDDSLIFYQA